MVRRTASVLVAIATVLVVTGAAVVLFLNPVWVGAEQSRARADAWTGWSTGQVTEVTNGILHDLVLGPPDFAQTVDGQPVLDPREQQHMRDVRSVFGAFALAVLAGVVVMVLGLLAGRRRRWFWQGVAAGASVMAALIVVLGVFFGLAFDTAFELFHRLFFAAGTYSFDPATERLVQLLPDQFWFETSIAFGALLLVAAVVLAFYARRRIRGTALTVGETGGHEGD